MHKLLTILLILTVLSLCPLCVTAATIRVPADQPTIQAGIDAASDGDTVLVADGTYTGVGNRDLRLRGKTITLRSENGPENCVVDAEGRADVLTINEGETRETIVYGLTITGGYPYGILIDGASPVILNCVVSGNTYGINSTPASDQPRIASTQVTHNTRRGVQIGTRDEVIDSVIRYNEGGGVSCTGGLITNCLIADNSTLHDGAGIHVEFGIIDVLNCTIVSNTAGGFGGGLYAAGALADLENCILLGNSADVGDQYALDLDYYGYSSWLSIFYSDVVGDAYVGGGGTTTGQGVIDEDPLFVSGPLGSRYLSQTAAGQTAQSPCVDTGNPAAVLVPGTTRTDSVLDAGVVDMGYHYGDPDEDIPPDTLILSGPEDGVLISSPVVVFTFTGTDWEYPASALTYSWRFNDEPWSDWSPRTWGAISGLDGQMSDISFDVRARDPDGDIDPHPARRLFHQVDWTIGDKFTRFAAGPGPGPGNPPLVRTSLGQWTAYNVMLHGVNVAAGDIDGDGFDEVITGPGPGAVFGPHVRCFQPDGTVIGGAGFLAYGTNKYGVNVACGDVDGDGTDEIITGAGPGAVFGPHVRGWNWDGGPGIAPIPGISFMAYGTNKYGVNVACGDIDGDGTDEIVTGAGPGAVFGPHVRGWRFGGGGTSPMSDVNFFAFSTPRWGVTVACGDLDGDGIDEIITGVGPGPEFSPHVRAWDYDGAEIAQMPGISFFAYPNQLYGAVVGAADVDQDGRDELLTMPGPGPSNGAWLRAWDVESGSAQFDNENWNFNAFDHWMTHGGNIAGSKNGWE